MSLRSDERGRKTWRVVESQGKRTFQGGNCPIGLDVSRSSRSSAELDTKAVPVFLVLGVALLLYS